MGLVVRKTIILVVKVRNLSLGQGIARGVKNGEPAIGRSVFTLQI